MGSLHYQLIIRNAADTADDIVVTSVPGDVNPYVAEEGLPDGEGQTLNPTTGEVSTGALTIGVIDAIDAIAVEELVASDGLNHVDAAAMTTAGWTLTDTLSIAAFDVGATDQVDEGTRSLKGIISGNPGIGNTGKLEATRVFGPADGIQPLTFYTIKVKGRMNARDWWDVSTKLVCDAKTDAVQTAGVWQELVVTGTSNADGELTVSLRRTASYPYVQNFLFWFDDLRIYTFLTGEDRIITSRLADAQGRQQLLSRRAYIKESETEGASWDVLVAGYLNALELTTALRFTFTVGESRRIEQTTKVFEVAEPGFDRVSCIIGGPIIGDFGPLPDDGRPRFQVAEVTASYVKLSWIGGFIYRPLSEEHPPLEEQNRDFINALASHYAGDPDPAIPDWDERTPFPDLRARLFKADTAPGVTENYPTGIDRDFVPLTAIVGAGRIFNREPALLSNSDAVYLYWPDDAAYPTRPDVGDVFKLAIFPRTISEQNPLHWRGHPVDFVTGLMTLRGEVYNAASATATKVELGPIEVEYRITASMTLAAAKEQLAYGPFGFAARTNSDGEQEFFTTRRRVSDVPVDTLTLDDLRDATPPIWKIDEGSAVNKVTYRLRQFSAVGGLPEEAPIDYLNAPSVPYEAVPDASDFEVYGDRSITYDLPGRLLNTDPVDFVAAQAAEIFEERGRGAILTTVACLRGRTAALIGQEVVLDFPHLPTANPTQNPVSQRGTTPRIALVLRRTPTPGGPDLLLQDRGIALQASLTPEFTVTQSTTDPRKIATVEITNGPALEAAGVTVRVEWAVSGAEPTSTRLLRTLDPATGPLIFDTPAVCAGSTVWVRMRTEEVGKRPGAWSAFESVALDALDAPTSLAGSVISGAVDLTWTLGANAADMPLEVLRRVDGATLWESIIVLPAGSTQYQLALPDAETDYDVGVRHKEPPPFGCASSIATLDLSSAAALQLTAPINPSVFADGHGTFGLEVTATALPSGTEFWVAVETAVGSGVAGTYERMGTVASVADGRTSFTNPTVAPNDGKLRYLKARHTRDSWTPSDYTTPLSINPWLLITPTPTEPAPEPDPAIKDATVVIPLFRAGIMGAGAIGLPAARTPMGDGRGMQSIYPLDQMLAIRLIAGVAESEQPVGAVVSADFEDPDAVGVWGSIDGAGGPSIAIDPDSLDLLDANEDETAWVTRSEWVAIRDEALADVRLRAVTEFGDTGIFIPTFVDLEVRAVAATGQSQQTTSPPPDDPGSCDVPSDLDTFAYADQAAAFAAWPED